MEFYIGIIPEDKPKLFELFKELGVSIKYEFDDPHGYYTYVIDSTWDVYKILLEDKILKSLTHYEE